MKFGETSDSIYAYSFSVEEGYSTPGWAYDQAVKYLFANDKTLLDVIDFGARERRSAEFNLAFVPKSAYFAVMAYFNAHLGDKIRVELESTAERVFGEQITDTVNYAYMTGFDPAGELAFSHDRSHFGLSVRLDYAGPTPTSIPNGANTSKYEFMVRLDCARVTTGCQVANKAALDAVTTKPGGSRGLTLDTLKIYFFNSDPNRQVGGVVVGPGWEYQYKLPDNMPAMGLKNGVFRWSMFADVLSTSTGLDGEDWKGGWLNKGSLKWSRFSAERARQGPTVEIPQGYAFSVDNSKKTWKFPLDYNLAFMGAYAESFIYDRANGILQPIRTGYNNRNTFDLKDLEFQIEPKVLLTTTSFPPDTASQTNYPSVTQEQKGKTLLATYGRWDRGELQTIAFNMPTVRFANGRKLLGMVAWNSGAKELTVDIHPDQITGALGSLYSSYPETNYRFLYCAIFSQKGQADEKKLRKVNSVALSSGYAKLTLDEGFASVVDSTAQIIIYLSTIQVLVDSKPVVGLRAAEYLRKGDTNGKAPLEFYGDSDDGLKSIPPNTFNVIPGTGESQITVNTNNIALEATGAMTVSDTVPLVNLNPSHLHEVMDKIHANGYPYFDFGFSPKGIDSNEVEVTAGEAVGGGFETGDGEAHLKASYSQSFTTLIWTPYVAYNFSAVLTTSYELRRYLLTYRKGSSLLEEPRERVLDTTFGTGTGVKLADGTTASASGGVVSIPDGAMFVAIDYSVDPNSTKAYEYVLESIYFLPPNDSTPQYATRKYSNRGFNRVVPSGSMGLRGIGIGNAVVLTWPVPANQASFTVYQDGNPIAGMPVASLTRGWYRITGLTEYQKYRFKVSVNSLAIGAGGDSWFIPAGTVSDHGVHYLLHSGGSYTSTPYAVLRDTLNSDVTSNTDLAYVKSWGMTIKRYNNDGLDLPAAAVVFSWAWKVDHEKLGDLSGARDVHVLADFCIRSYVASNTPVPFLIQIRGIRADKTMGFAYGYNNLTAKAPPEGSSFGAYSRFENLPKDLAGSNSNSNYDTESQDANADGLYTGKGMWKIPDVLFEDSALDWSAIEYLVFSITNAEPIPYEQVKPGGLGYRLGLGGPPLKNWAQVRNHKPDCYIEYLRQVDGGLQKPIIARIDGGRIDDASGTITGTPNKIIEKALHVTDHVIQTMLGLKPTYIGTEMRSRDGWIWHWQKKNASPILEVLQTLMKNLNAVLVWGPDDKPIIRSLNIDDPNAKVVYAFTDSNIVERSLGKTETRQRTEIYQKILLKFGIDPSQDGKATEEMMVSWDLAANKPIYSGYPMVGEDASGKAMELGGLDGLADLCRLSTQLNAAGLAQNEYGTDPNNPQVYEMFYRPTEPTRLTREPKERTLPNLVDLWGSGVKPPKMAMQELCREVVRFLCFDAWYFPYSSSMKNIVYNPDIAGVKDEAGTPEHRLKIMDIVTVASDHKTNGQALKGFILDIDPGPIYDGKVDLHFFAPRPPGQYGPLLDNRWDAGAPGARNTANFLFTGSLYGLRSEDGTFADAGQPGARNTTLYTFPDGSFADPKGSGTGKA